MTPAIEYLIRQDLIKDYLTMPFSLFLTERTTFKKMVLSVEDCFENHVLVKKWDLSSCSNFFPNMEKFKVLKKEIFSSSHIILPGYELLKCIETPINSYVNSNRSPMSFNLYNESCEKFLSNPENNIKREIWLWKEFVFTNAKNLDFKKYADILNFHYHSNGFKEKTFMKSEQFLIEKNMKKQWKCWLLWIENFMFQSGELFFRKEYDALSSLI